MWSEIKTRAHWSDPIFVLMAPLFVVNSQGPNKLAYMALLFVFALVLVALRLWLAPQGLNLSPLGKLLFMVATILVVGGMLILGLMFLT